MVTPEQIWDQLARVRKLAFVARSASSTGWNGKGSGTVAVQQVSDGVSTFDESGTWCTDEGRELRFYNTFRWSKADGTLRLEHLRFGVDHPVYLFDLAPAGEAEWRSVSPHLCSEDCYAASLAVHDDRVVLRWSVTGPNKQESIEYVYSW